MIGSIRTTFVTALALGLSLGVSTARADGDHGSCCGSCGGKNALASTTIPGTIVDVAKSAGSFTTLLAAAQAAGLVGALSGDGPLTVFAPTDEAFAKLPEGTVASLLKPANKDQLVAILTYHVVAGSVPASEVVKLTNAKTLNGQQVAIKVGDGGVSINGAKVLKTDIKATNGIIHVINSVILPSTTSLVTTALEAGKFNTLVAAVKAAGLAETLSSKGPFTVFAPTDEAFAKLPEGTIATLLKPENKGLLTAILTYHVVPGRVYAGDVVKLSHAGTVNGQSVAVTVSKSGVKVNDARVIATDIDASNGVIHVVDTVIMPSTDDIVQTAVKAGSFKTLAAALNAGGLIAALKDKGPFTVFAPTDEAFSKLPAGTVETLLKPENLSKLQAVLKYHVVSGRVYSGDALKARSATTLEGSTVRATKSESGVRINTANVVKADIETTNGVIHVIDGVLLPGIEEARAHRTARTMIVTAISHGSRMYNAGDPKACADLYMKTAHEIMQTDGNGMCPYSQKHFETAVKKAAAMECDDSRAWAMRHALDSALVALSP